jgi:hypothetical protein
MTDIGPVVEAHLADLFENGKEVLIVYPGKPETKVWIERPSPDQHQECLNNARATRARRFYELSEENSGERMAFVQETNALDKEELVEALLEKERRMLERQALNEVLFSEEFGSDWGNEGDKYSDLLGAISDRYAEINQRNNELKAANVDETNIVNPDDDEEIVRLSKIQETFEVEVKARRDELAADKRLEIAVHGIEKLREQMLEQRIALECDMVWFATFKFQQLFYATRYMADHSRLYFRNVSQIKGLPQLVQEQLMDGLNEVDIDVEALKNSLTPLLS